MSESDRLIDQFKRVQSGDPWYGSPLTDMLKDVTARQAVMKPPNGAHSIWELVLHITNWRLEVAARATGQPAGQPAAGDWPAVGAPTPARWKAALAALGASHLHLAKVVRGMSDARLLEPTNDPRTRRGTGDSYCELLHGIIQHDVYHAGQIAILKKNLGF